MVVDTPPLPLFRLLTLTCAMAGVQICYSAQINQGTPQLLLLGLPPHLISFAWLAGPLSGLIAQPVIGRLSDLCTSPHGRRRPFLVAGAFLTSFSLFLFSTAQFLPSKLVIAVVAFFLLDFSIQAVQAPLRALVTDVVPGGQRGVANACLAFFTGVGLLGGGLLTGVRLSSVFTWVTDVQGLFGVAALILLGTVAVSVFTVKENVGFERMPDDLGLSGGEDNEDETEGARGVHLALRGVPRPYWRVFTVQLCTWVGFFTLFVYGNAWVGQNVYLGDGGGDVGSIGREVFEKGVRLAGFANAVMAGVTIAYSMALPSLVKVFGVRSVYAFSQLVEALCLMVAPGIRGRGEVGEVGTGLKIAVVTVIALFGIVWATTMGVPWTLVGDALQSDDWYKKRVGLFQTLFNASQSFPQLVVAAGIAPLVLWLSGNDPAWVMFVGGCFAFVGAVLVIVLKVDVFDEGMRANSGIEMYQLCGVEESNDDAFDEF